MPLRFTIATLVASLVLCVAAPRPAAARPAEPTVAVMVLTAEGAAAGIGGGFDPGKALTTLLTDRLVEDGRLAVVERENVERVFDEQKLAQSDDFSAAQATKLGRMVNAQYLIVGRIVHLDKVATNSGGAGALLSRIPLNIGGAGASGEKVHCQVGVRLVDASTGRIVKAITFDQTQTGTSFAIGDAGTNTQIYSSQQFTSSVIGKLLNAAANDIARAVGDATVARTGGGAQIEATIIALDGSNIIINKGNADGVGSGTFFKTFHRVAVKDPTTGRTLVTDVPDGEIEIISVSDGSSVARKVSGTPAVGSIARTQ